MAAQFIGTSMTRGFAGELTRGYYDATTEVKANDATTPVVGFGVPVKLNTNADGVTPCSATADAVYGFAVREYGQAVPKIRSSALVDEQDQALVTVMKRGYMAVKLASGTAKLGGTVYLNATGGLTADAGSAPANTAIPNCIFMGAADSDGLVEIAFNI